jgi:ABC-type cobalamin/Fe3+-siderophores transport systems, ATPase components
VLLATVLVVDPPILLADEPAAALDIRHRLDVVAALAHRGRERLSIVVVHDLDLAFRSSSASSCSTAVALPRTARPRG